MSGAEDGRTHVSTESSADCHTARVLPVLHSRKNRYSPVDLLLRDNTSHWFIHGIIVTVPWIYFYAITLDVERHCF
jgi:hypothetical protein